MVRKLMSTALYKHILVALENSATDRAILEHIRPLARIHGSCLLLIHVADGFVARYQNQLDLQDSEEMRKDMAYLEACQASLTQDGIDVNICLEQGDAAKRIVFIAEQRRCDLIAMSTHGHRAIKDLFLGSVASAVRHATTIPVLLVRGNTGEPHST